jgi:hypothetical protein
LTLETDKTWGADIKNGEIGSGAGGDEKVLDIGFG